MQEMYRTTPREQNRTHSRNHWGMATIAIDNRATQRGNFRLGLVLLGTYVALYAATLFAMVRLGGFDAGDALGVFGVLGVGFSLIAWLLTLGVKPLPYYV